MSTADLERAVEAAWEARETLSPKTGGAAAEAVEDALALLDSGEARVAEKQGDGWIVNQWLKKAVLLSFRLQDMETIPGGPGADTHWYDKVPSKFAGWDEARFQEAGLPCRAQRHRAALGLRRARRGADALVREYRRLCRQRHHDRHLGHGGELRADRQELPYLGRHRHRRRAGAAPGEPGDHRGTTALSAPAARWRKESLSSRALCWRWASSSARRPG